MAADAELHPADGWKSVLCVKGCSSGTRAWVYFLLVLIISCVFHWNVFTSAVRSNELSVDTYFYVETARELTRLFAGEDAYVDPLRTPGYPLILMGFAALQGVDLRDTGHVAGKLDRAKRFGLSPAAIHPDCAAGAFLLPAAFALRGVLSCFA